MRTTQHDIDEGTPLVPTEQPRVDGQRYRLSGKDDENGLQLFIADDAGPWKRIYGSIVAV
jgi:hypothetical protein